jgi:hypothetical protein
MNSILIYCGHETFGEFFPFSWYQENGGGRLHGNLLAMNMVGTACWILLAFYYYKIKFFVKI